MHFISFCLIVLSPTHPAPNLKASGCVRRSSLLRIHLLFSELYSADLEWTGVKLIHALSDSEMALSPPAGELLLQETEPGTLRPRLDVVHLKHDTFHSA